MSISEELGETAVTIEEAFEGEERSTGFVLMLVELMVGKGKEGMAMISSQANTNKHR